MKSIQGKLYFVYILIFTAIIATVISYYVAVNTYDQHLMLTELLAKHSKAVDRVMDKVTSLSEIKSVDEDVFYEIRSDGIETIKAYQIQVDDVLETFISRNYFYDGKYEELIYEGDFEEQFIKVLKIAEKNWENAKSSIDSLIMSEKDYAESFDEKLKSFEETDKMLADDVKLITELCREEANKQREISRYTQIGTLSLAFAILVWLIIFINRSIRNPIFEIRNAFTDMSEGNYDISLSRKDDDEFKRLFDDFNLFIKNRNSVLELEDHILSEDNLRIILKEMLVVFNDFVKLERISIVYSDSFDRHTKINSDDLLVEEVDEVEVYEKIDCIDDLTLVMPINVNNVYLGYAIFKKIEKYTNRDINFVSGLEKKIGFTFYKSLVFKDLLSIVTSGLADMTESRDPETRKHLIRMSYYSQIIARKLYIKNEFSNEVDEEFVDNIKFVAPMHDIGKVSVPDDILLKPGKLTYDEYEIMKTHAVEGAKVLTKIDERFSRYNLYQFEMAVDIANYHQEKFDGTGYPEELSGEDIPLSARICAVADVFDALTSKRPYKEAFSLEKSYNIIRDSSGTHFDSRLVDAFFECQDEVERVYYKYREI